MRDIVLKFIFAVFLAFLIGCEPRERQYETEAQTARGIMNLLTMYSYRYPEIWVTNFSQVLMVAPQPYPHELHRRFAQFGKNAGFTNSIYEKYVFLPRGVSNRWIEGEIVLMNARPYPSVRGEMHRTVISRKGDQYHRFALGEETVQEIFRHSRITEPAPIPMPRPSPAPPEDKYEEPLHVSVERHLGDVATRYLGLGRGDWWVVLLAYVAAFAVPVTIIILVVKLRSRR